VQNSELPPVSARLQAVPVTLVKPYALGLASTSLTRPKALTGMMPSPSWARPAFKVWL